MSKDPAVLFYIDKWLTATAEMDSDVRGWYLNLILHQFDKGSVPNDLEKLASLACVKFSEFARFEQMFNQVLKQKFIENEDGRLENEYAREIMKSRELFKDKRSKSGNIGVIMKVAKTIKGFSFIHLNRLKLELFEMDSEQLDKHKDKQVLEQKLKLYLNINVDSIKKDIDGLKNEFLSDKDLITFSKDNKGISEQAAKKYLKMFWDMQELGNKIGNRDFSELRQHYMNWIAARDISKDGRRDEAKQGEGIYKAKWAKQ